MLLYSGFVVSKKLLALCNEYMYFSSADANSVNVTPSQDTPISNRVDGKFINFDVDVEIQKPIEKLPRGAVNCF